MNGKLKTFGNALKNTVMEREDEMLILRKPFRPMIWMNRVHSFESTNPRRIPNFEHCVWLETSLC